METPEICRTAPGESTLRLGLAARDAPDRLRRTHWQPVCGVLLAGAQTARQRAAA